MYVKQMNQLKRHLEDHSPLYSVLIDQVVDFLEPCVDYDVFNCTHKNAFCSCGNIFQSRGHAGGGRVWLEKFCPWCGAPNKHNPPGRQSGSTRLPQFQSRPGKYFFCPQCAAFVNCVEYKYCPQCRHKLKWRARLCSIS